VHTGGVIAELRRQSEQFDFAIEHVSVELTGLCSRCR
jgi:Fe2+ or Zn2+ uptake regulation protein